MTITVKDGSGSDVGLKTTADGTDEVPHHHVDSSALPTGAATAANQATLIGHMDGVEALLGTMDSDTSALAGTVLGSELQVDIVTSALPSGASTAANQTTIIGHLDGVETSLTAIDTKLGTLDNAISGNEMQVDIVSSALPSGAATAANQTTMIGHLDGVETALTAIEVATEAIQAAAEDTDPVIVQTVGEYETVAASQTAQVLGASGASGDRLEGILVIPATTSPGNVLILDNATSITVFAGGASSVSNLIPFFIPLSINSVSGAWKVTTGANVSCIAIGNFS